MADKAVAVHTLKVWPPYFDAVARGDKTFEVRRNDRGFQRGDLLHLREWDPEARLFTHRDMRVRVTYVYAGDPSFGLDLHGFVVLGLGKPMTASPLLALARLLREGPS